MHNTPFDTPSAWRINQARAEVLDPLLGVFRRAMHLHTALDVGCGIGVFSGHLQQCGLDVQAVDGRAENVVEARRRNPALPVTVHDVEDPQILTLGTFDLVLCFGLLYHLENPFLAVRHLAALTGSVLLIESVVAPWHEPVTVLYEEPMAANQGLRYVALVPSETWLVKCLYRCGFAQVYRPALMPEHPDYRASLLKHRRRTVLAATRQTVWDPLLVPAPEPTTRRYLWDRIDLEALPPLLRLREWARQAWPGRA